MPAKDKELRIVPLTEAMLDEAAEKNLVIDVPVDDLVFDNVRSSYPPESVHWMAESLKQNSQQNPIIITTSKVVFDGMGRVLGARQNGWPTLKSAVIKTGMTRTQWKIGQLTTSIIRDPLSGWDLYQSLMDLLGLNTDWDQVRLASHLARNTSTISRWLSPSKCTVEVREALRAGKISIGDCVKLSQVPEDQQATILAERLHGAIANRDDMERAVRTRKKQSPKTDSTAAREPRKAVLVLRSGTTITVAGKQLDVRKVIEEFVEALKALRKMKDWDLRTIEQVLRDEAGGIDEGQAA